MSKRKKFVFLFVVVALGLVLRIRGLDRLGLNEDEVSKVVAARAYLRGDFSRELEHPMLMKSFIAMSLVATDSWNRGLGLSHPISEEVAVRLPNCIFGSLTAIVIFLLAQEFFGVEVGLLGAWLWSIGTIALMDNRLAKEDTLLVFFAWLGYYFYLRAKKLANADGGGSEKFYAASGASFGLMLASKYIPHYPVLIFIFYYLYGMRARYPPRRRRDTALLFGACILALVLADPVFLSPSTWRYLLYYVREGTITHHGYLMMGRFCFEDPSHLADGMPVYFYPMILLLKTPLPVLIALVVGLAETWRRQHEPGPFFLIVMFLFWIVPFSLLSAKWLRYMLSWMPPVYIISALGVARIFAWASGLRGAPRHRRWVQSVRWAVALVFLATPAWISAKSSPYYTLYLNPLGLGRTAFYFPHDEMNDLGLREAIRMICDEAPHRARVGGGTRPVFEYYFRRFGRDDLRYFDLSDRMSEGEAPASPYLVIQDGRKYVENVTFVSMVESYQAPVQTIFIEGIPAARIYRINEIQQGENNTVKSNSNFVVQREGNNDHVQQEAHKRNEPRVQTEPDCR
jgi:hypothetical protein